MAHRIRSMAKMRSRAARFAAERHLHLPIHEFIHRPAATGFLLLLAAVAALVWANSSGADSYHQLWQTRLGFSAGSWTFVHDLRHWINDGLMAVFFLLVGLEVKEEMTHGALASARKAALPIAGALGGMVLPALIYVAVNAGPWAGAAGNAGGWGVPMATDIAFALGVLALVGDRVPRALVVFLLALAVADDIGAILVIAVFYAHDTDYRALALAIALLAVIYAMIRSGVATLAFFVPLGIGLWAAVHASGIHATLAGVALGLMAPAKPAISPNEFTVRATALVRDHEAARAGRDHDRAEAVLGELEELTAHTESPVERLQRTFAPITGYVILPLFALANAGVELSTDSFAALMGSPVAWGVALGLLIGKPLGILLFAWAAVRAGLTELPAEIRWRSLAGVGLLAGIGFTVAIFIANLAFAQADQLAAAKIAILGSSLVAGALGWAALRASASTPR